MSARKLKNAGWAAFDLKQQQVVGLKPEAGDEPYPPISSTNVPKNQTRFIKNNDMPARSFSSVLLPSANFPTLGSSKDADKSLGIGTSSTHDVITDNCNNNANQDYKKLTELYPWAEKSLIEDIIEAVYNDINKASDLLKGMASSSSLHDNKEIEVMDYEYKAENFYSENNTFLAGIDMNLREAQDLVGVTYEQKKPTDDYATPEKDYLTNEMQSLRSLPYIPVEPEWQEDDIYLIHRKDAIRMMRLASRHSKAASDAYLRGDHLSAQQNSTKAREEWKEAERFNAMAAKDILIKRNCNNDVWKLDLHGLHASEAVQALKEHLHMIESQLTSSTKMSNNTSMVRCASLDSLCTVTEKGDKQKAAYRPRARVLEVITGIGLHSRGQAALPSAVETYLSENRYHYDKSRPGMIAVRPKFRRP